MIYVDKGEKTREFYRNQGEQRLIERVLSGLRSDAIIMNDMPVYLLERVTAILENSNELE